MIGALHLIGEDPYYSSVHCHSDCKLLTLTAPQLQLVLAKNPDLNYDVLYSLSKSVRSMTKELQATPLLSQHARKVENQVAVVSAAAFIESFFRSSLNAWLNATLSKKQLELKHLFPNMHIQSECLLIEID